MKKLITSITISLMILQAQGQVYLIPGIGLNDKAYFVAGIGANWQIDRIQLTAEMIDNVNVKGALNTGGKIGVTLYKAGSFAVTPAVGYYYHYFTSDKNEFQIGKNYWSAGYFLKGETDKLFIEAGYIKEFNLRIGLKLKL